MGECTQRRRDRGTTRGRRNADGLANGVGRPRGTRGRPTPPPHHAAASSKGNAPAWAGAAARYRTRPPSCGIGRSAPSGNAGGDAGIHDYPQAVLHPMRGRDQSAAPKGLHHAVRTRAAPYTSPSLTSICLLQAGVRPSAFPAPRAFKDPATKGPKPKSKQDKDCATGPSAYRTCSFLIAVGTHQTSHLGS